MPSRPKKRQSLGRSKPAPWSAPSKRQQTITQMDPFHSIFHPQPDQENLEYDERVAHVYEGPHRGPKRRKLSHEETTGRRITRSEMKKNSACALAMNPKSSGFNKAQNSPKPKSEDSTLMPPPLTTPQRKRQKVIPSSQSPPDTPLSNQSRRSIRDVYQSPLKEKSTNIILPASEGKYIRWAGRREIADSMEKEEDDNSPLWMDNSKSAARSSGQGSRINRSQDLKRAPTEDSQQKDSLETRYSIVRTGHPLIKSETTAMDRQDECNEDFETKNDFWAASSSMAPLLNSPALEAGHTMGDGRQCPRLGSEYLANSAQKSGTEQGIFGTHHDITWPSNPLEDMESKGSSAPTRSPQFESESQEASIQLVNDLRRATQAQPGVETESQFENAWHSYKPPPPDDPETQCSLHYASSPPPGIPGESIQKPITINSQHPTPPYDDGFAKPFRKPIPPSQATTVDITQPSPRKSSHCSSTPLQSSPPPMPPPTSSPMLSRKTTMDECPGYEWSGGELTDSQLLPASLMEDSLVRPPEAWSREIDSEDE
ncbi:MAG: hypothetical protein Q9217_001643 [Psora testacea]